MSPTLRKIPSVIVLRICTREISKLQNDILIEQNKKSLHDLQNCHMICMLVENRTFHPVLYFWKQPKRGVPKN